jgi:threonine dehydratase
MSAQPISLDDIQAARARGADIVKVTPLDRSTTLSALCGRDVGLKLENLQKTGSFKVRGALNKIQLLDAGARGRGVVAASAGNHAQGVAYAARMAGVRATVVMPETASLSKVEATRGYGAEVLLTGRSYRDAYVRAAALADERGATLVHAFDDAQVMTGQGTIGLELLEQMPDVDVVVVPVGGGGLLAGIACALRGVGCRARLVGVQVAGAATLGASLRAGGRVELAAVDTIADGLATGSLGALPFEILRAEGAGGGLDVVDVTDAEVGAAVLFLLERAKTVVEGAGAVGVAACLAGRVPAAGSRVAVVISGGNIDTNLLDRIINLGLIQEGRLFRFETELVDRPGELERLVACIAAASANIHQIRHERALPGLPLTRVVVVLDVETRGHEHAGEIETALVRAGFTVRRDHAPRPAAPVPAGGP